MRQKNNGRMSRILSMIVAAAMVFGMFFANVKNVFAAPWNTTDVVQFTDDGATEGSKWPKKYAGNENGTVVAFCINESYNANPKDYPNRFYLDEWAVDADGVSYLASAVIENNKGGNPLSYGDADKLRLLFRKVLAYGYAGGDPEGLFAGYSDGQLYEVTQAAVYQVAHYGAEAIENLPAGGATFAGTHTSAEDVKKLLDIAYDDSYPDPSGELYLFVSMVNNGGGMSYAGGQNLIGGEFTVQPKPEEPEEPEEPEDEPEDEQPEGSLKTTVTAEGKSGSESEAAKIMAGENGEITTDVTDKIDYENLVKGATYEVRGTLIEKESEEEVATATESKVAEDTNGTWELTFSAVTLKAGKTYVVFEEAQMTKNAEGEDVENAEVIEHKDIEDKAQTLVVEEPTPEEPEETSEEGKLATTVTADGVKASADAPAEVNIGAEESKEIRIVDTISYKDLTAGATYRVQGTLVEVVDGKAGDVVATSEEILCVADESGSGDWEILIGESVKVEPGKTYVVFEKAVLVKDAEGNDVEDGEELTHEDVNDKAQTIVVTGDEKTEEVPAPIVPEDDSKKDQGVKGAYEEPDKTSEKTTEDKPVIGNSRTIPATSTSTGRASAPKTGDVNQMALWLGLFAAAGFSALLLRKRAK